MPDLHGKPVMIVGAGGMLGRALVEASRRRGPDVVACAGRRDLDVTDASAVQRELDAVRPGVVINATGYNEVDGAESEPGLARAVNCLGPAPLAAESILASMPAATAELVP